MYLPLNMDPPDLVCMPKGRLTVATDPEPVLPPDASSIISCALIEVSLVVVVLLYMPRHIVLL